jgi:hypothetical protein
MIPGDNLDHGGSSWRRFMVTMPITDRDEIARAGYEAIAGQDQRAAAEALRLFISNAVACLDVQR